MKMKCLMFFVLTMFFSDVQGRDSPTTLDHSWFIFVSATPTNITLQRHSGLVMYTYVSGIGIENDDFGKAFGGDNAPEWGVRLLKDDKEFTIPIDQEIQFAYGNHSQSFHTPVTFKRQDKGFRILNTSDEYAFGRGLVTNSIAYVAMIDNTPVEADEDDVETILTNGEWVTLEEHRAIRQREHEEEEMRLQAQGEENERRIRAKAEAAAEAARKRLGDEAQTATTAPAFLSRNLLGHTRSSSSNFIEAFSTVPRISFIVPFVSSAASTTK